MPLGLWLHQCRKAMGKGELPPNLQADIEAAVGPQLMDRLWGAWQLVPVERGAGAVCGGQDSP